MCLFFNYRSLSSVAAILKPIGVDPIVSEVLRVIEPGVVVILVRTRQGVQHDAPG